MTERPILSLAQRLNGRSWAAQLGAIDEVPKAGVVSVEIKRRRTIPETANDAR